MIYNSVDNIPAKLYFEILSSGHYGLLVYEGKHTLKEIEDAWNNIESENSDQPGNSGLEKILTISRKVEMFSCEYEGVSMALHLLKAFRDVEVIERLKEEGYTFKWKQGIDTEENESLWIEDLKRIENEIDGLRIRLEAAKEKLPDEEEDSKSKSNKPVTFESTCLSYSTFIEAGFVDTNKITLSQFNAIVSIGNEKIKNLGNGTK